MPIPDRIRSSSCPKRKPLIITAVLFQQGAENGDRCGFSCAVWTQKGKDFPFIHLKADVFDNRCSLIGFTELLNADTCLHDIPPLQNACFSAVYANQEGDISQNTCGNSGVLGYMNYRL